MSILFSGKNAIHAFFLDKIEFRLYFCHMNKIISKQFHAALTYFLAQEGRGAQSRLAREQKIDAGYLNAIVKGRKSGAEEIRIKIATHFGMDYEDMLALGRAILDGKDILSAGKRGATAEGDEGLCLATEMENLAVEFTGPEKAEARRISISEKIVKVVAILESDSNYRDTLSDLIDDFYGAISVKKDNLVLEERIKEIELRMIDLERLANEKNQGGRSG